MNTFIITFRIGYQGIFFASLGITRKQDCECTYISTMLKVLLSKQTRGYATCAIIAVSGKHVDFIYVYQSELIQVNINNTNNIEIINKYKLHHIFFARLLQFQLKCNNCMRTRGLSLIPSSY